MLRFECTSVTPFDNHTEVRFDMAGTPGGHVMIRIPTGHGVELDFPEVGSFHQVMLRPDAAPAPAAKTGPVDVSSDTLMNQGQGGTDGAGAIASQGVGVAGTGPGNAFDPSAGQPAAGSDPDPAAGQAERV